MCPDGMELRPGGTTLSIIDSVFVNSFNLSFWMCNNVRTTIKFSLGKTVQLVFMSHRFHQFRLRRRSSSSHYGTVIRQCFVQNRMAIRRSVSVRNAEYYYNVQPHLASSFRTRKNSRLSRPALTADRLSLSIKRNFRWNDNRVWEYATSGSLRVKPSS